MSGNSNIYRIYLNELHKEQRRLYYTKSRYNVGDISRRWGKSEFAKDLTVSPSLHGFPVGYFAPQSAQFKKTWDYCKIALKPITASVDSRLNIIYLINGGACYFYTIKNIDAALGNNFKRIIIDEAARDKRLDYTWNTVLQPTLADLHGDAWFLSTPQGKDAFYDLWKKGQPGDDHEEGWKSWQLTTSILDAEGKVIGSNNPYIPYKELEQQRKNMPKKRWEQEHLASFDAQEGTIFDPAWFTNFIDRSMLPPGLVWYRYWDTASSVKQMADFSASFAFAVDAKANLYIRDIVNVKKEFNDLIDEMKSTFIMDQGYHTIQGVEQKANGISVFQRLKDDPEVRRSGVQIFDIPVVGDKRERANKWSWYGQYGKMFIVNGPNVRTLRDQASTFTGEDLPGVHDDIIDSGSGGNYMFENKIGGRMVVLR